jgi:hypothetical protein
MRDDGRVVELGHRIAALELDEEIKALEKRVRPRTIGPGRKR